MKHLVSIMGLLFGLVTAAWADTIPAGALEYKFKPEPYRGVYVSATQPSNGWQIDVADHTHVFVTFYTFTALGDPVFWTMFAPLTWTSNEEYKTTGVMVRAIGNPYTARNGTVFGTTIAQSATTTPVPGGQLMLEWTSPRQATVSQGGTSIVIVQAELNAPNWSGDYLAISRRVIDYPQGGPQDVPDDFKTSTPIVRFTALPSNTVYRVSANEVPGTDLHPVEAGSYVYTVQCRTDCANTIFASAGSFPVLWHINRAGRGFISRYRDVSTTNEQRILETFLSETVGSGSAAIREPRLFGQRDSLIMRNPESSGYAAPYFVESLLIKMTSGTLSGQ